MSPTTAQPTHVGVDVSKNDLEVSVLPGGDSFGVPNDEGGLDELADRLESVRPTVVVLEATGGFERPVAAALAARGIAVAVVNPRQVRDFAKATGKLAKTDALDARSSPGSPRLSVPNPRAPRMPKRGNFRPSSPEDGSSSPR